MIPVRLQTAFEESASGFFRDNVGSAPKISPVVDLKIIADQNVVAAIGFASDIAKGTVLMVTFEECLRVSHPMTLLGHPVESKDLYDWAGEIANQTLGRLKSALLPYGMTLNLSVPAVIYGHDLQITDKLRGERLVRTAALNSDFIFGFCLDITFAKGFDASEIDRMQPVQQSVIKEGDAIVF